MTEANPQNETAEETREAGAVKKAKKLIPSLSTLGVITYTVVIIAITVTITGKQTRSIVNNNLYEYHTQYGQEGSKILVVDMNKAITTFKEQGANTRETMEATNALLATMSNEGYLVIDSRAALSAHENYIFQEASYKQLLTYAELEGIDVSEGVEEALRAAEDVSRMMRQMNGHD